MEVRGRALGVVNGQPFHCLFGFHGLVRGSVRCLHALEFELRLHATRNPLRPRSGSAQASRLRVEPRAFLLRVTPQRKMFGADGRRGKWATNRYRPAG